MKRSKAVTVIVKKVGKSPKTRRVVPSPSSLEQIVRGPYDSKELMEIGDVFIFFSKDHARRTCHLSLRGTDLGGHVAVAKMRAGLLDEMNDAEVSGAIALLTEFEHRGVTGADVDDDVTNRASRSVDELLADEEWYLSTIDKSDRAVVIVALAEFERHLLRRFRATLKRPSALDAINVPFRHLLVLARSQDIIDSDLFTTLGEFEKLRNRLAHVASYDVGAKEVHQLRGLLPEDGFFGDLDYLISCAVGPSAQDHGIDLSAEARTLRGIATAIELTLRSDLP